MVTALDKPNVTQKDRLSRQVLELVADKWTALVFYALESGPCRFAELRRTIEGISQKMLSQTLRDLERNGLVARTVYPSVPPAVEYQLTPLGRTLSEPIHALVQWAEGHLPEVELARATFDAGLPAGSSLI